MFKLCAVALAPGARRLAGDDLDRRHQRRHGRRLPRRRRLLLLSCSCSACPCRPLACVLLLWIHPRRRLLRGLPLRVVPGNSPDLKPAPRSAFVDGVRARRRRGQYSESTAHLAASPRRAGRGTRCTPHERALAKSLAASFRAGRALLFPPVEEASSPLPCRRQNTAVPLALSHHAFCGADAISARRSASVPTINRAEMRPTHDNRIVEAWRIPDARRLPRGEMLHGPGRLRNG